MSISSLSSIARNIIKPTSATSSSIATGSDNISTTNLIYFYNFESAGVSGSTFKNGITGGTADLTLYGSNYITTTSTLVKNGTGSLQINSTNYAKFNNTSALNLYSATQSIALKFLLTTPGNYNQIFVTYSGGTVNGWLQVYQNGAVYTLRYYFYNGSAELVISTTIAINTWYSVVITKNGGTIQVFLNGSYVTQNTTSNCMFFNNDTTGSFVIGRDTIQYTLTFVGNVDDLRIYNRVLTGAEILTLHNTLT